MNEELRQKALKFNEAEKKSFNALIAGGYTPEESINLIIGGQDTDRTFKEQASEAVDKIGQGFKDIGTFKGRKILSGVADVIEGGFGVAGATLESADDAILSGSTGRAFTKIAEPIVNTDFVKSVIGELNKFDKRTGGVAGDIFTIGSVLPIGRVAKIAVKEGEILSKLKTTPLSEYFSKVKITENLPDKINQIIKPTTEKAIGNTYKGLSDLVENSKSLLKDFTKREGSGKDPIRVIAENPDYIVSINSEAKTIDAFKSISNLKRDVKEFSGLRDVLLSTADETLPPIYTNDIIKNAIENISAKNYKNYLDEGTKAVKQVLNKLKSLKKFNPETISRIDLNEVRKGLDETINTFTNTKLKDKLRLDLRRVFKETLENSIPDNTLLKELNLKIGDLLDTEDFLSKKLNGAKIKGGALTDLGIKLTGSNLGGIIGAGAGGVIAGPVGILGGYAVSDFLSKNLIKNAINNPFDRKVLEKLMQQKPEIVNKVEEYIDNLKNVKPGTLEVVKPKQ